ncbi:hypothetical protein SAMN05444392_10886 [Seinonella peptonophila]|uniref:Phage holin family Hol44, holin superfamily V n=1 Tax=Seinonella peptonophila TaxID=112248 RepID=A0A1M4Z7H3_9BACL|nr:hypothetical protein [Seinonella peptonophila]SHF14009.1 hypothetical protein SAMN05444392_10886 [Seinonella peptonophila]
MFSSGIQMVEYDNVIIIGLITGLVSLLKEVGLPHKWAPLFALFCGLFFGVVYLSYGSLLQGIYTGLILGLGSIGLYSGPKNLIEKVKK